MASLIDELISVMGEENKIYADLIPIENEKTRVIIKNDLTALQDITGKEQAVIETIGVLERKREEVIVNIGTVLSKDPKTLDMKTLIRLMSKQPEIKDKLTRIHDELSSTVHRLVRINEKNNQLIEQSLEMIEFDMNLLKSMKSAPGTNNYNLRGTAQDMSAVYGRSSFDTKQ